MVRKSFDNIYPLENGTKVRVIGRRGERDVGCIGYAYRVPANDGTQKEPTYALFSAPHSIPMEQWEWEKLAVFAHSQLQPISDPRSN